MDSFTPTYDEIAAGRVHESAVVVSLDKLIFTSSYPFDREALKARSQKANRGDGYITELPNSNGATMFFADAFDDGLRFSLNPAKFKSVWECIGSIEEILGSKINSAKIKSIDVALTFPCDFTSLYMGLDFGQRRSIRHHGFENSGRTVYVGKIGKKSELKIYDKRKQIESTARKVKKKRQSLIDYPCSRIEITWVPEEDLTLQNISQVLEIEPFGNVTAYHFKFIAPSKTARPKTWRRFYEFEQLCLRWGYWHSKKMLNQMYGNNFSRSYRNFYDLDEMKPSLNEIYREGIRGFFQQ